MNSSWLRATVRGIPTGSFGFVMATGIVSSAFETIGRQGLSRALLLIAVVALAVLAVGTVLRLCLFAGEVWHDTRDPTHAFGLFTIVAALNVVATRTYDAAPTTAVVLALISVPFWVVLSYGLPANLMLRPHHGSVAEKVDGSWFLWVVATQSVALVAAVIGRDHHTHGLAGTAVALWGIGFMLYLMLATLVTLRLLAVQVDAAAFNPSYWIYMGATAITVLAGAQILELPANLPIIAATSDVVSGLTYVMWAFGLWWVPLLIVFEVWRHGAHHVPVSYEHGLWSIVFPLGMFATASMRFGAVIAVPLLVDIGRVTTWIGGAAWLLVLIAMLRAAAVRPRAG